MGLLPFILMGKLPFKSFLVHSGYRANIVPVIIDQGPFAQLSDCIYI